ncbi:MAG: HEAT repeat domain-containing protein [Acidobacteriota bacterium]
MRTLSGLFLVVSALLAQQPQIENAKLETRPFSGTLESQLRQFGAGPFWAGYAEPILAGRHGDMCWNNSNGPNDQQHAPGAPVRLEGQTTLVILIRVENSQVDQLRVTSADCLLDAGALPFYWLSGVPPEASVAWLKTQVTGAHPDRAVLPIALHAGPAADRALQDLIAPTQPERVRERTAFWLGSSRGAGGVEVLRRMLATDPSPKVREQVIFALSQSKEPAGLATVMDAAKNDRSPQIRSKALFWLAQKAAGKQTEDVIKNAVVNDPERSVKEQAVFALKQLPESEGVPLLIEVAKNNPDPAVRKKAIFWLGQSKDSRALDFFAQVLKP